MVMENYCVGGIDLRTAEVRQAALLGAAVRRVLEQAGIDCSVSTSRSMVDAARFAGIPLPRLRQMIEYALYEAHPRSCRIDWRDRSNFEIIRFLMKNHHQYLDDRLPFIDGLFRRVLERHQDHRAMHSKLHIRFQIAAAQLLPHMRQEERYFFPALMTGELGWSLPGMARKLEEEHREIRELMGRIRRTVQADLPAEDAPPAVQMLYQELRELEEMLREHLFLENNILFPRASPAWQPCPQLMR